MCIVKKGEDILWFQTYKIVFLNEHNNIGWKTTFYFYLYPLKIIKVCQKLGRKKENRILLYSFPIVLPWRGICLLLLYSQQITTYFSPKSCLTHFLKINFHWSIKIQNTKEGNWSITYTLQSLPLSYSEQYNTSGLIYREVQSNRYTKK